MEMPERIARMEAQVEAIKEDMSEVKTDIKDLHSRITTGNREIVDRLDCMESKIEERMEESAAASRKQHLEIEVNVKKDIKQINDRVDILERWRWMIVGGAIAVGYLMSHIDLFGKFMK
jgi:DNA repair exonuclease SbcCD ATPase subunit